MPARIAIARAVAAACLLAVLGGCRGGTPERLVVADRLLVAGRDAGGQAVDWCELDAESRPAVGCAKASFDGVAEVEASPPSLRAHIAIPSTLRDRPLIVQSKLLFPGDPTPKFLPGAVLREARGPAIDLDLPLAGDLPAGQAKLDYRLRSLPPPVREIETRPIAVERGAQLDLGVALDPLATWLGDSPVLMEVVARRPSGDATLFREVLDPGGDDVGHWHDRRVDLSAVAGETVRLVLKSRALAAPGGADDLAFAFPVWGPANLLVPRPGGRTRNVLLISIDTLRADALGAYGSSRPTSPGIDRFARSATLFERVYATWPATLESHMSLFTGLYPAAYGQLRLEVPVSNSVATLPERIAAAGFQTAAVTEDGMVVAALGFRRGVDRYRENKTSFVNAVGHVGETFADGLAWLSRHRDERFFLFLHTYQVHAPYTPPPEYDRFRTAHSQAQVAPGMKPPPQWERDHELYLGEVLYADAELQKLLDGLDALGLADDTVVILTADHGEEFGEHGLSGHGKALFEESLHVPLIVRAPGVAPAGLRVPALASLTDVLPTALELAGVAAPAPDPDIQGRSLVPLLADPDAPALADRAVFSELHDELFDLFAARKGSDVWIFDARPSPRLFVYDRRADPGEKTRLVDEALAARGQALRGDFLAHAEDVKSRVASASSAPTPLDDATTAKLRALGYLK